MDVASTIAAYIGAVSGVVALVWQIATRRRSAHRVTVERSSSIILGGWDYDPDAAARVYLCVTARNIGASPVTVDSWGVELGRRNGGIAVVNPLPQSARLPYRLDAGESINVFALAEDLRRTAEERGVPTARLRAFVRLGTGETVRANRGCPV